MSTPRTESFFTEAAMKDFAKYPAARFCAELETELADATKERDEWKKKYYDVDLWREKRKNARNGRGE